MGPLGICFSGFLTSFHREENFREIAAEVQNHREEKAAVSPYPLTPHPLFSGNSRFHITTL